MAKLFRRADNDRAERERSVALVESGADLGGAWVGAAVGLVSGPVGALAGAAAGVAATRAFRRVGSELEQRWMGPRQRLRAGAAYGVAAAAIAERLDAGEAPRTDGFFDRAGGDRAAAEELLEGVLQAAADAHEERKVAFLGTLYASVAFDESVSKAYANLLIRTARRLSFRQLVLMAVLWDGDAAELAALAAQEGPPRSLVSSEELAPEVDELERLGLLSRGEPGGSPKRGGMTFVDASSVSLTDLSLSMHGKQLYELMGLRDVSAAERRELLDEMWRVGLAD